MVELVWLAGLFGGVVLVAALVNWLARDRRRRLKRVVVLFALCATTTSASFAATRFDPGWAQGLHIAGDLFAALTLANMAGMLLFLVLLPALAIRLPMIAGDLVVGLGYVVATIVVLSRHGLDPTSALATGAVVSAVLAISLQTTLGNILGGVALQLDGSIHEGDLIRLGDGKSGRVQSIRWRHTLIDTGASTVVVPNAQLLANNITILGWRGEPPFPQPASVAFGVDFGVSPARVTKLVADAIAESPIDNMAAKPAPLCRCTDLLGGDGYATYSLAYTVIDPDRGETTASHVRERIYTALRRARIQLAVPGRANAIEVRDHARVDAEHGAQMAKYIEALHSVHLFHPLTEPELRTLAQGMTYVPFAPGETIMRQGAAAHSLFVLTAGTAEVRARLDPDGVGPRPEQTRLVATITAPDFFGEMGLLTGEPRRADVIAKTDVECFRLPQDTFERVLLARPEIVNELSERLASRRVGLIAAHEHLDEAAQMSRHVSERERIRDGIRDFFGL
jgi:small-conductance mechanosensitive channel